MGIHVKELHTEGFEKVVEVKDPTRQLHAFIAVHDTTLGPALGGIRFLPYETPQEALTDVLRLASGMTYKSTIVELPAGGGKSTVIWDPKRPKPEPLLQAFAEAINCLEGQYVGAEDMNCSLDDVATMHKSSPHILGLPGEGSGDPARFTAYGVFISIQATLQRLFGSPCLKGKKVVIQGAGGVGEKLIERLFWAGADLYISDLRPDVLKHICHEYGATPISHDEVYSIPCDIFAPCARGGILNPETIPLLNCKAVVGAANNQLMNPEDGLLLSKRSILYAPDYLANAGGVISVASEMPGGDPDLKKVLAQVNTIFDRLLQIYETAEKKGICTSVAADQFVEKHLTKIKKERDALV